MIGTRKEFEQKLTKITKEKIIAPAAYSPLVPLYASCASVQTLPLGSGYAGLGEDLGESMKNWRFCKSLIQNKNRGSVKPRLVWQTYACCRAPQSASRLETLKCRRHRLNNHQPQVTFTKKHGLCHDEGAAWF